MGRYRKLIRNALNLFLCPSVLNNYKFLTMKMAPLPPLLFICTDAYRYVRCLGNHLGWERHNYNNSKGAVFRRLDLPSDLLPHTGDSVGP